MLDDYNYMASIIILYNQIFYNYRQVGVKCHHNILIYIRSCKIEFIFGRKVIKLIYRQLVYDQFAILSFCEIFKIGERL